MTLTSKGYYSKATCIMIYILQLETYKFHPVQSTLPRLSLSAVCWRNLPAERGDSRIDF